MRYRMAFGIILIIIVEGILSMPNQFSFQGRLTDESGFPAEGTYPVTLRLYETQTDGTPLWEESHILQFSAGLFNVIAGTVTEIPISIFDHDSLFLETVVDGDALSPRRKIVPQPYAIRAHYADSAGDFNLDTLGAYLDTTSHYLSGFKISGSEWISDSLILIAGTNIDLSQTANMITINSTASGDVDDDWTLDDSNLYSSPDRNIGIGTSSPEAKLQIAGNIMIDGRMIIDGLTSRVETDTVLTISEGLIFKTPFNPGAGRWASSDSVLYTDNALGIARGGAENILLGANKHTHVNLGRSSHTGSSSGDAIGCAIGGGDSNVASANYATISGGYDNTTSGIYATVCGGMGNQATDEYSTIAGGVGNRAIHRYSFVGGGYQNHADYLWATIAGGNRNEALWDHTFIGGGERNIVDGEGGVIAGGRFNLNNGDLASIGGGLADTVKGHLGVIAGGFANKAGDKLVDSAATVGGGMNNEAEGKFSTVCGGYHNHAKGDRSIVAGGSFLRVGTRSFGFRGGLSGNPNTLVDVSSMDETFHVVDANFYFNYTNTTADFIIDGSTDDLLHCDGFLNRVSVNSDVAYGYKFYVNGNAAKPGDATWAVYSDRRLKTNIRDYDLGLAEIIKLQPKKFSYSGENNIDLSPDDEFTGAIAQEVREVIPQAVEETESGYLALRTDPIIWAMVNAIQELEEQNSKLEQRIEDLQEKLDNH